MVATAPPVNGSDTGLVLNKPAKNELEFNYVPLGEKEPIKLTIALALRYLMPPSRKGVRATEQDAMKFLMLCRARELNPWVGDAYAVAYDKGENYAEFQLITAVQALFKRAELHPEYDGVASGVIVRRKDRGGETFPVLEREGDFFADDEVLLGGWANVYRKDCSRPFIEKVKLATFDKKISVWSSNPEGMISKIAEAGALRKAFPNQIGGLYTREEMDAQASGVVDVAEKPKVISDMDSLAKELSEKQAKQKAIVQQEEPTSLVVEQLETAGVPSGPGSHREVHAEQVDDSEGSRVDAEPDIIGDYRRQIAECEDMTDLRLIESSIKRSKVLDNDEKLVLARALKTRSDAIARVQ